MKSKKILIFIAILGLLALIPSFFKLSDVKDAIDKVFPDKDIEFVVNGKDYTTKEGTTWREFLENNTVSIGSNYSVVITDFGYLQFMTNAYIFANSDYPRIRVKADDVIFAQEYYAYSYMLTFTYGNTRYSFECGMTWADFCGSKYNTLNLIVQEGTNAIVNRVSGYRLYNSSGEQVYASDSVLSYTYTLKATAIV